jgi:hypothetical protein
VAIIHNSTGWNCGLRKSVGFFYSRRAKDKFVEVVEEHRAHEISTEVEIAEESAFRRVICTKRSRGKSTREWTTVL